jgi:hypothetical protein
VAGHHWSRETDDFVGEAVISETVLRTWGQFEDATAIRHDRSPRRVVISGATGSMPFHRQRQGLTRTGTRIWHDKPRPGGKRPVAACALLARSRPVQHIRCETPTDPAGSGGVAGDPAGRGDGGLRQHNRSTPTRPRHPRQGLTASRRHLDCADKQKTQP